MRSGCCARAASDPPAVAPPTSAMKSRRFIRAPRRHAIGHASRRGAVSASQPEQDNTPRCGRRLLRCGISIPAWTASGQTPNPPFATPCQLPPRT
jgi:hypothetical protein